MGEQVLARHWWDARDRSCLEIERHGPSMAWWLACAQYGWVIQQEKSIGAGAAISRSLDAPAQWNSRALVRSARLLGPLVSRAASDRHAQNNNDLGAQGSRGLGKRKPAARALLHATAFKLPAAATKQARGQAARREILCDWSPILFSTRRPCFFFFFLLWVELLGGPAATTEMRSSGTRSALAALSIRARGTTCVLQSTVKVDPPDGRRRRGRGRR